MSRAGRIAAAAALVALVARQLWFERQVAGAILARDAEFERWARENHAAIREMDARHRAADRRGVQAMRRRGRVVLWGHRTGDSLAGAAP